MFACLGPLVPTSGTFFEYRRGVSKASASFEDKRLWGKCGISLDDKPLRIISLGGRLLALCVEVCHTSVMCVDARDDDGLPLQVEALSTLAEFLGSVESFPRVFAGHFKLE